MIYGPTVHVDVHNEVATPQVLHANTVRLAFDSLRVYAMPLCMIKGENRL